MKLSEEKNNVEEKDSAKQESSLSSEQNVQPHSGSGHKETKRNMRIKNKLIAKNARRKLYPNGVDILAIIGIILGASLITALAGAILMNIKGLDHNFLNSLMYFLQFALAIGFVALQRRARGAKTNIINFKSGRLSAPLILWGVLLITVTGIVIEPVINLFPSEYLDFLYKSIGTGGWAILTTVVLAPIMEEVLFRGLIQGSISAKYGPTAGILLSALIFGLVHGIPQQVVSAFLIGIILGYIYYRTNSLLTVILLHFLNNGIAYLQLELLGDKAADFSLSGLISNEKLYYVVYGISLALMIVGAVAIIRNLHKQDKNRKAVAEAENNPAVE